MSLDAEKAAKTTTSATALRGDPPKYSPFDSGDFVSSYAVAGELSPPLDIFTVGKLPAIIVDASIDALESSAIIEDGSELIDLSAIGTFDVELGSVVVSSGSSAAALSGATVVFFQTYSI